MTAIRVLLVDDHGVVREGLRSLLAAHPGIEVVGEAADGSAAVDRAAELRPDVVVMDITMPGLNGARATGRVRTACPGVKVLALTAHEDKAYLRQMLEAGATGYVLKRAAAGELVQAVRAVAAGGVYLDPALAGYVAGGLVSAATKQALTGSELSDREEEVVRLVADGYSNKQIATRLVLSVKTVETYKARSMEKLGLKDRIELVRYARRRGWLEAI